MQLLWQFWKLFTFFATVLNYCVVVAKYSIFGVEEIHSVGTINNVETSYFTQLKICYLMTTFRWKVHFIEVQCNVCLHWVVTSSVIVWSTRTRWWCLFQFKIWVLFGFTFLSSCVRVCAIGANVHLLSLWPYLWIQWFDYMQWRSHCANANAILYFV